MQALTQEVETHLSRGVGGFSVTAHGHTDYRGRAGGSRKDGAEHWAFRPSRVDLRGLRRVTVV